MKVFPICPRHSTDVASAAISDQCVPAPRDGIQVFQKPPPKKQCRRSQVCGQRSLVLSLMTLSILIFHTPQQVYVTLWFITEIDVPSVLAPFNLMLAVPAILDPILFTITLSDVRKVVLGFFRMGIRQCSSKVATVPEL